MKIVCLFFKILRDNFPPQHKYFQIFNITTIKHSYSAVTNLSSVMATNNDSKLKRVLIIIILMI